MAHHFPVLQESFQGRRLLTLRCGLALAAGLALAGPATAQDGRVLPRPDVALVHANVIDVRTGDIDPDVTVVVRDGRIASLGAVTLPPGANVIDVAGRYVLPGLIDAHTHLDTLVQAKRALESGVTTVRGASVGSYKDVVIGEMARAGFIAGPDYLGAGVYVTPYIEEGVLADPRLMRLAVPVESQASTEIGRPRR